MDIEKLRYPIGKFESPSNITAEILTAWISILEHFPNRLVSLVENLSEAQLNTPYRPDGWTVKQVVHHVYDSHHNSYIRFKWALTEATPLIKVYQEADWAKGRDYAAPIQLSLQAITSLHAKLVYLLKGMTPDDFLKEFVHPEKEQKVSLAQNTGMYAWHSNHHYAHIENLLKREGWK
ncbi:YfiT family bacillithiol transferase [Ulvibacter litoralis]|uniref:DinB superfamily protein n=1 Tax=Ulvibacter litoralis TaxID=227084 RepID=A0A1G7GXC6_9FLAO|nr:putative metal-dependent hydrolase [Ulvibacter litoralis]GHC59778.1 putative metal-dependent hydrolase [Ulvibacter litoralis]SDE92818.1 DinB superfamily protein [Ulvibacter litoralis]